MSHLNIGQKDEDDSDARSRQIDDGKSIMNSVSLLKSLKDVKVQNVCGSTAGAGSGTFHKYRQQKRREQFRIDRLKKEEKIKKINERIKKRKRDNDEALEAKRNKKRKLRQKKRERRMRAKTQGNEEEEGEQKKGDSPSPDNAVDTNTMQNDEDKQLQELLNIDKALSDEQEQGAKIDVNRGDNTETEQTENSLQSDSAKTQHEKKSDDGSKTMSKRDAILAALDAEFGDLDDR